MQVLLQGSKNPTYELEVMPVLVAISLWGQQCQNSQVCWYLDNEASRTAYLKAYGATVIADGLVAAFTRAEMALQIKSWFARAPSASDLADAPSRGEDSNLRDRGAVKTTTLLSVVRETLAAGFFNRGSHGSGPNDVFPSARKKWRVRSPLQPSEAVNFVCEFYLEKKVV